MTESNHQVPDQEEQRQDTGKHRRFRRPCLLIAVILLLLLLLIAIVVLILALTVFKVKEPRTQLLSASVEGISPRLSLPVVRVQINMTLSLQIRVENRNRASFRHGMGQSTLCYGDDKVGEADIYPGLIPAMGSATMGCRLTLLVDELASAAMPLVRDVLADGLLVMEARTRVPGRVSIFGGLIRKHAVAISLCQFTIGFPDMKIRSQDCQHKTKF